MESIIMCPSNPHHRLRRAIIIRHANTKQYKIMTMACWLFIGVFVSVLPSPSVGLVSSSQEGIQSHSPQEHVIPIVLSSDQEDHDDIKIGTDSPPSQEEDDDAEEWQEPLPPVNLRVKSSDGGVPVASFNWEAPPQLGEGWKSKLTGFKLTLEPYSLEVEEEIDMHHPMGLSSSLHPTSFLLDVEHTHFTTDKVVPLQHGRSYGVSIQSEFHTRLSQPIETNFTIRPNPLDRFVVWYRNETCFLVLWQPPAHGVFQSYKAELFPPESPTSTIFVSRWDYQYGGTRPGFFSLTPGKAYNISVSTQSGGLESAPIFKEYRTMPLPVSNVTLTIVTFQEGEISNKVLVEWEPPSLLEGEYDGFNIFIKRDEWGKPKQKFIPRNKLPRTHLDDAGLIVGQEYEVVVKTVSGKVSSHPATSTFTYFLPISPPLPPPSLPDEVYNGAETDRNDFD